MAPTVVRDGPYRLFFFSREEPRNHVHVARPHHSPHLKEIEDAWEHHFNG